MDLRSIMNDGPAGATSQQAPSRDHAQAPPARPDLPPAYGRSTSAQYATPPLQQHSSPSNYHPGYPPQPPPLDTRNSAYSSSSSNAQNTPLRTPQPQTPSSAYPFPHQYQSPGPIQQSRPPERLLSLSSGNRPPSQAYGAGTQVPYHPSPPPPTANSYQVPHPAASHSRMSMTPVSAHPHSPQATRDPSYPHHGLAQNPYGQSQHPSQPSTPLGPPSAGPRGPVQIVSPYAQHRRSFSGSAERRPITSSSPAPHPAGYPSQSPASFAAPPPPLKKRSTEHIHQQERDRSVSVSPKTMVNSRYPSGSGMERQNTHEHHVNVETRGPAQRPQPHMDPRSSISEHSQYQQSAQPPLSRSSTGVHSHSVPSPLSRDNSYAYTNGQPQANQLRNHPAQVLDHGSRPDLGPPRPSEISAHERPVSHDIPAPKPPSLLQQPVAQFQQDQREEPQVLKRKAEQHPEVQQEPTKRPRIQHPEPPSWARYHPRNPLFDAQNDRYPQLKGKPVPDPSMKPARTPNAVPHEAPAARAAPSPAQARQQNGVLEQSAGSGKKTKVQQLTGMRWEMSITDMAPSDQLLTRIMRFLYLTMLTRPELGAGNSRDGSLEIEAKIGTLVDRNTNDRLALPVETACVLNEGFSKNRLRFESFMTEEQHKTFNLMLNEMAKSSQAPGRTPIDYRHRYERDHTSTLNTAGLSSLPPSARPEIERLAQERGPRNLHIGLRTTYDDNARQRAAAAKPPANAPAGPAPIIAQIVKLRLADLDVYCPADVFDVRISVNIEISLHDRPDLDLSLLTTDAIEAGPDSGATAGGKKPDRCKDRLSYTHLANSIDLTQVTYAHDAGADAKDMAAARNQPKTHELEVELDAKLLRDQAEKLRVQQDNCYEELVEAWVNDVLLLVRAGRD